MILTTTKAGRDAYGAPLRGAAVAAGCPALVFVKISEFEIRFEFEFAF